MLMNNTTFLLDKSMDTLKKIHEVEETQEQQQCRQCLAIQQVRRFLKTIGVVW